MNLGIVILAAGQGTRMQSALPKVLHPLAGKPLLAHVIDTALTLQPRRVVVVYGHGGEQVRSAFAARDDIAWAEQAAQLGTGHAVQQALPHLDGLDRVLVLYGDVPLIRQSTLQRLIDGTESDLGLLTVTLEDPSGYGRIVRDSAGNVLRIVEQKDASAEQLAIREINTGIMLLGAARLRHWLQRLSNHNAQGEYYLTDVIEMAVHEGVAVHVAQPAHPVEAEGVNNRLQLATLERAYQRERAEELLLAGVSLADPARFDLRGRLRHGRDVSLDINVVIEGEVSLGNNVRVGANSVLRNVTVGDDVEILEHCVLEDAEIGAASRIGPFSRLRPGARLVGGAHVGNFVEIKQSLIGQGSKVNHLTYVGDAEIGAGVNIGAGTITCNYDGANKHKTVIGDRAFIGSNTALVAPVTVGAGATIGAGSVITKGAPADKLTLTRARQLTLDGWQRPVKKPKE
ncbi:MAG: bifunctional UDP-N-acetylglucosamine pyrophosphorylase/Glucosamine-phosphate N-acetyltransferase [Pseudomonadota bacterium]